MKKIIISFMSILIMGCSNLEKDYNENIEKFNYYSEISSKYQINKEWWNEYKDQELNNFIEIALKNNPDLIKSAISINKALYEANLIGSDLYPTFSSDFQSSVNKDLKTGDSITNHKGEINLSYEIDLWRKLKDSKDAQEWEYKATIEDYENIKITLINNIINSYFSIMYLKNCIFELKNIIKNYQEINKIVSNKIKYGSEDISAKKEIEKELLENKNTLLFYEKELNTQETLLKNLLNLKPHENLNIKNKDIIKVKNLKIDLDIPLEVISNRPDVKALEYRLRSSFKKAVASEKQLYPNLALSSGINSEHRKIKNSFNTPIGFGTLEINLPFLNWNEVKWNVKIDKANYEESKINFEKGINEALNEISENYYNYKNQNKNYTNLEQIFDSSKIISNVYKNKYLYGKAELKDWLNSIIDKNNSKLSLLEAKYELIKSENLIYQSIGGKIINNPHKF